jgi:hypothetical protein
MKAIALGVAWAVCTALLGALGMAPDTAKWTGFVLVLVLGAGIPGASVAPRKEA